MGIASPQIFIQNPIYWTIEQIIKATAGNTEPRVTQNRSFCTSEHVRALMGKKKGYFNI